MTKLITKAQMTKLLKNWEVKDCGTLKPVLKLFTPDASATWLVVAAVEIEEDDDFWLFGLADLGLGFVEWGDTSLNEIKSIRGRLNLPVERDRYATFTKTMNEYYNEAQANQRLTV